MEASDSLVARPREGEGVMQATDNVVGQGDGAAQRTCFRRLEYGCVRRLRRRRLLAYLSRQGLVGTFQELIHETSDDFFSLDRLTELVEKGQWDDAVRYLSRFLPPESAPRSLDAHVLVHFVRNHGILAKIVAGDKDTIRTLTGKYGLYHSHGPTIGNGTVRIRGIILSILYSEQARASLDWDRVRSKAVGRVRQMAVTTPELTRLLRLPERSLRPDDVLPLGFSYRQGRHVKTQGPRPSTSDVIDALHKCKRRMRESPKSDHTVGLSPKAIDILAVKLDESLMSAIRVELYHARKLLKFPHLKKGAPGTSTSHTHIGTLADFGNNSGVSSLANGGAPGASTLHTHIGTSADFGKNSGVSPLANGGASGVPALHTNLGLADVTKKPGVLSLTNGGAPVAPISQTMELRCSENTGISSLTSAEGAPVASISQDINLTVPSENTDVSSVTNDSAVAMISESINSACHAKNTGILSVTNADSLASGNMSQHVKNSGVSSATSASSESPVQKNICFFEQKCVDQDNDPKRKKKNGKFTRATMETVLETDAEAGDEETSTEAEDRPESTV